LNELKSGINDKAANDQCNKDMLETIPSCQEWSSKRQALLNSLQEDRSKNFSTYYGAQMPPLTWPGP